MTITGTNLSGATAVRFGSEPATITANTPTSVSVLVPAGAGQVDARVATPGGVSGPVSFFYLPPPTLHSVSPALGPVAGGATVTLLGRGLSSVTSVAFGSTSVTPTVVSDQQLTVVTPATAAGDAALVVTTRGGVSSEGSFTFVPPPTATSFTPLTGLPAGGTTVTISGTGLATTTGVTFGGVAATFAALSDTQLAAIAPVHGLGTVTIAVTTTGGSATAPGSFLYLL